MIKNQIIIICEVFLDCNNREIHFHVNDFAMSDFNWSLKGRINSYKIKLKTSLKI